MFFSYSPQQVEQNRKFYLKMCDFSHCLVQIDQLVNWNDLYEKLKLYYPKQIGRPTVCPIVLVKILMIQCLDGFRSVRFTCKQIQQNATYRWFLGISPFTKIPDHSTISKFLWKRLNGPTFWRKVFNDHLIMIHQEGFLAHETWIADETEKLQKINQFRIQHGKKPLKEKESKNILKRVNKSPVDPDAALSVKHEKRGRFAYFEHRIVDSLHNFIIETRVTAANVPGHRILPSQLDSLRNHFGRYSKELALDSGYYNAKLATQLIKRKIFMYIAYRRTPTKEHPQCRKTQFHRVNDCLYSCPCGVPFYYRTTTREGYHEFKPPKDGCNGCSSVKKWVKIAHFGYLFTKKFTT